MSDASCLESFVLLVFERLNKVYLTGFSIFNKVQRAVLVVDGADAPSTTSLLFLIFVSSGLPLGIFLGLSIVDCFDGAAYSEELLAALWPASESALNVQFRAATGKRDVDMLHAFEQFFRSVPHLKRINFLQLVFVDVDWLSFRAAIEASELQLEDVNLFLQLLSLLCQSDLCFRLDVVTFEATLVLNRAEEDGVVLGELVHKLFDGSLSFEHLNVSGRERYLKHLPVAVGRQLALLDSFLDDFL